MISLTKMHPNKMCKQEALKTVLKRIKKTAYVDRKPQDLISFWTRAIVSPEHVETTKTGSLGPNLHH